jgi:hypothetical protein
MESEFRFQWESQKLEPKIEIPNQAEQHVCLQRIGKQGGQERVANGKSGKAIGTRLMPTGRAHLD